MFYVIRPYFEMAKQGSLDKFMKRREPECVQESSCESSQSDGSDVKIKSSPIKKRLRTKTKFIRNYDSSYIQFGFVAWLMEN